MKHKIQLLPFRVKSPTTAKREFMEWSSLFSGKLFVKLIAYADDSGTHDTTGIQPGAREAVIAGMVGPREEWGSFCKEWQAALNDYGAPYFHFSEWRAAVSALRHKRKPNSDDKNPYRGWDQSKLDRFIVDLATIAGSGNKLIVGMAVSVNVFHAAQTAGQIPAEDNPYEQCADRFFNSVVSTINSQRAPWKRQPIAFFFDQTSDKRFVNTVTDMFLEHKKQHRTFKEITFANKKDYPHLPLQAADMVAYRARRSTQNWVDGEDGYWEAVDPALFKSLHTFVNFHEQTFLRAYFRGALDYPPKR